jgi:hypothetical protein
MLRSLAVMFAVWWVVPALVLWRRRLPVRERYQGYDRRRHVIPRSALAEITGQGRELDAAGFMPCGGLLVRERGGWTLLAALHEEPSGEAVAVVLAHMRHDQLRGHVFLNVFTRFADGGRLTTDNDLFDRELPAAPGDTVSKFSHLLSASEVVRLHRAAAQRCARPIVAQQVGVDPAGFLGRWVDEDRARQLPHGALWQPHDGSDYRLTLRGAARQLWRSGFPQAFVVWAWERRRGFHLAADLAGQRAPAA